MKHRHPDRPGSRRGLRRRPRQALSTLVAILGLLSFSAGVSMIVQGGAQAAASHKVVVCHATDSDSNPYIAYTVDSSSAKLRGHLKHRNNPIQVWKGDGTWNGVAHHAGDLKRDYIGSYTDRQGTFHALDGNISPGFCNAPVKPVYTVVDGTIQVTQATCSSPTATWTASGAHITFSPASGSVTPDPATAKAVTSTGTADTAGGYAFAGGAATKTFTAQVQPFDPGGCTVQQGPREVTPAVTFTEPTCAAPQGSWTGADTADIDYSPQLTGSTLTVTATLIDAVKTIFKQGAQTTFTNTNWGAPTGCGTTTTRQPLTPAVSFTDPTCAAPVGSWSGSQPSLIGYRVASASGAQVTVTASVLDPAKYEFAAGAQTSFSHTWTTPTNCGGSDARTVRPDVRFVDPTCHADGTWHGAHPAAVAYSEVSDGDAATVTATPRSGYRFPAGATSVFSHTWVAATGCKTASGGVTDAGTTQQGPTIPTVVHSGMTSLAPVASVAPPDGESLVRWGIGLAGLGMVLSGVGFLTGRRRPRLT